MELSKKLSDGFCGEISFVGNPLLWDNPFLAILGKLLGGKSNNVTA